MQREFINLSWTALNQFQRGPGQRRAICTIGWVKYYKKFEIEHFTGCGDVILPKKVRKKTNY